jgi:hypothetical protein
MATYSSTSNNSNPPQTIYYDTSEAKLECGIRPTRLDEQQRKNIRKRSGELRRILVVDRKNRKYRSIFVDYWAKRCKPSTVEMLVSMLGSDNGTWPNLQPNGMQLLELCIAFEVFRCENLTLLKNSNGFRRAADHLLFYQDPEQISEVEEDLYALTTGKMRNR